MKKFIALAFFLTTVLIVNAQEREVTYVKTPNIPYKAINTWQLLPGGDLYFFRKKVKVKGLEWDSWLYGIRNSKKEIIVEPKYSDIGHAEYTNIVETLLDRFIVVKRGYKDSYYLLIDLKTGKEITPDKRGYSFDTDNDVLVIHGPYNGVFGKDGSEILPLKFESITKQGDKYEVLDNGKITYYDLTGKELAKSNYTSISEPLSNGCRFVSANSKYGVIDKDGKEILPTVYDYIQLFDTKNNYWSVQSNGKLGLVDNNGKELSPMVDGDYFEHFENNEDLLIVTKKIDLGNGASTFKHGLVDEKGKELLPTIYYLIDDKFKHGLTKIMIDGGLGKTGFIDTKGKILIPCEYDYNNEVTKNGLVALVKNKMFHSIVDSTGKTIVPFGKYDWANDSRTINRLIVSKNRKCGIVDFAGKEITPLKYDDIITYYDDLPKGKGLIIVNNKRGIIDCITGKEVTPCEYDVFFGFQEGMYVVRQGKKYGYMDDTGKVVIPVQYDSAERFYNGTAVVNNTIVIDKTGKVIETLPVWDNLTTNERIAKIEQKWASGGKVSQTDKDWASKYNHELYKQYQAASAQQQAANASLVGETFFSKEPNDKHRYKITSYTKGDGSASSITGDRVTIEGINYPFKMQYSISDLWKYYRQGAHKYVTCSACNGTGIHTNKSTHEYDQTISQGRIVKVTTTTTDKCSECNGTGKIEVIE